MYADSIYRHPSVKNCLTILKCSFSRIIRLSSPNLNYMIGGGAILLYIAIILIVVPVGEGDSARATALCVITPWFTAIGYSLCYGTILVKMFRTWYIFNKPIANKIQV